MAPQVVSYSGSTTPMNRKSNNPRTNQQTKRYATGKSAAKSRNVERSNKDTVNVYLRLRPLKLDEPTLTRISDQEVKTLPPDGSEEQVYAFTKVFENAPQSEIFDNVARPIVEDFIVSDKDGLIFTYGITGSGKTYTMEGLKSDPGLIYRTIDFIFNSVGSQQTRKNLIENDAHNSYQVSEREQLYPTLGRETPSAIPSVIKWQNRTKETARVDVDPSAYYCLFISLIELYNKQVHDLFEDFDTQTSEKEKRKKEIYNDKRGKSYVAGAVEIEVKSADEAVEYYTRGIRRRKTGSTALNQESSRGHCVLSLKLVHVKKSYEQEFDKSSLVSRQLCLVDLAGSERAKRSGATGGALHEAGNINNSLGALRKCIRALRDRELAGNVNCNYRDYSLTRLFQSYFEGYGHVCMVLCVKPTSEDFYENNIAMEFGLLTQEVAVDYASPPKMLKRAKCRTQDPSYAIMYEYFEKKIPQYDMNPDLTDEEFMGTWIARLKSNRDKRKKYVETAFGAQNEVRLNILATMDKSQSLKQQYETRAKELRAREEQLDLIASKLNTTERSKEQMTDRVKALERQVRDLDEKNRRARDISHHFEMRQAQNEKLYMDILNLLKTEQNRSDALRRVVQLLKRMKPEEWSNAEPSAPEMEPLQSSSPVDVPNPSGTETAMSTTPPTTSNSSMEPTDFNEAPARTSSRILLSSPTNGGVPIVNPRHNRSLSCSNMHWIHHKPSGTIDTGTVLRPKLKNGRSVKNLRSSDILRKDAGGYSVVHQDADQNGDVETSIYKGRIISTVSGGAQVILDDIETMKQASPKRKRAASDAHYTH